MANFRRTGHRFPFFTKLTASIQLGFIGLGGLWGLGAPLTASAQSKSDTPVAEVRTEVSAPVPGGILNSELLGRTASLSDVAFGFRRLGLNSEGPDVQAVQEALLFLGYEVRGGADGDYGNNTLRAVQEFSRDHGLETLMVVDSDVLSRLDEVLVKAESISTSRFRSPEFMAVAAGTVQLAEDHPNSDVNEVLQVSLYSLGYDLGATYVDGDFGGATTNAIKAFQRDQELPETGVVDTSTISALDAAAALQLAGLSAATKADDGTRAEQYEIVGDLVSNRLYVVNVETQEPVQRYLTSPGKRGKETRGSDFEITRRLVRRTWYPTPSMQARGLTPKKAGLTNPMGLMKFDLGRYYQYIHGTPFSVRGALGRPASSGCFRMSSENILHLEQFVEVGTKVTVNRDPDVSRRLSAAAEQSGLEDTPLDSGREGLAGYLTGELGTEHVPQR